MLKTKSWEMFILSLTRLEPIVNMKRRRKEEKKPPTQIRQGNRLKKAPANTLQIFIL